MEWVSKYVSFLNGTVLVHGHVIRTPVGLTAILLSGFCLAKATVTDSWVMKIAYFEAAQFVFLI